MALTYILVTVLLNVPKTENKVECMSLYLRLVGCQKIAFAKAPVDWIKISLNNGCNMSQAKIVQ